MKSRLTSRCVLLWLAAIMLLPLVAEAADQPGGSAAVSVTIDEQTAARRYPVTTNDGLFRLDLAPGRVNAGATVVLAADDAQSYPGLDKLQAVTPVYTVDVHGAKQGKRQAFIEVDFQFTEANVYRKTIAAFHRDANRWQLLPTSVDWERHRARTAIPWTFGRLALFEDRRFHEVGLASWYRHRGCLCAASPDYQPGSRLRVTDIATKQAIVVRVNDYGPDRSLYPDRVIDLDRTAFQRLTHLRHGLVSVLVQPLSP